MNQEIKIIAPSKSVFQNMGTLQNCSLKKKKMHFRTWVHFKTAFLKNAFQN